MGSCRDLGARVTARGEGPQDSGFTWPRAPRPAVWAEEGLLQPHPASAFPGQHTWFPLSHSPGTQVFPAAPGVPTLTAQALQASPLTVLLLWHRGPHLHLQSTLPLPLPPKPLLPASWPLSPQQTPPTPPSTPPPHLSWATTSLMPAPSPPPFSHQHLNPADCPHPLDSRHRT